MQIMKKTVLTLIIIYFCLSDIYSQYLSKMTIGSYNQDIIAINICKDGKLGIIVFYSVIKNLEFEALSPLTGGNAIVNTEYISSDNCYIICVQPQGETNFSIKIAAKGFYPETYKVGSLGAKEKKIYIINSEDNTIKLTVLDKNGNSLDGCRVGIKGTDYVGYSDSKGICKIELPTSNPATLVISHRLYEDTTEIIVKPGANQSVRLHRLKPVTNIEDANENFKKEIDKPKGENRGVAGLYEQEYVVKQYINGTYKGYIRKIKQGQDTFGWNIEKRHGQGSFIWNNGDRYDGNYVNGIMSGYGILRSKIRKFRYEGNFENNDYNGKGIYYHDDGWRHEGYFKNGQPHGEGTRYDKKGKVQKKGIWENGEFKSK
jgi:hypothetical protein